MCAILRLARCFIAFFLSPSSSYSRLVGSNRTKFTLLRLPKAATSKVREEQDSKGSILIYPRRYIRAGI